MDKSVAMMVTLTLLLGGALVAFPESASAQAPTGSLRGLVCTMDWGDEPRPLTGTEKMDGCYGSLLPDATVRLQRTDVTTGTGAFDSTVQADRNGAFSFSQVPDGKYAITITRTGFEDHNGQLDVAGGSSYETSLRGKELQVTGRVVDPNGAGIARAQVYLSGATYKELKPGSDGSFSTTLRAGNYYVSANAPGYQQGSLNRLIDGSSALTLTLEPLPPQTSRISGTVTDQLGRPVADVRVTVSQGGYCCYEVEDGDVPPGHAAPQPAIATESTSAGSSGSGDADAAVSIARPEPYPYYGENWTTTDAQGRYSINVFEGHVNLRAERDGYFGSWAELRLSKDEQRTHDFKMEKLPDKTALIAGRVTDAAGNGISFLSISIDSPRWGLYECSGEWEGCKITVRADGSFEAAVTPGYSIVRIYHEQWRACTETTNADGSSRRDCGPEYFSWTKTLNLPANQTTRIDAQLLQRPMPDATVSGYIVDGATNTAIKGARISFGHQLGHGYGWATTDGDGSYKVRVHSGVHYVSVWAEGYLPWEGVVQFSRGAANPFDVILTAGEARYGGCCYGPIAYAEGDAGGLAADRAGGAPPAAPSRASAAGGLAADGDEEAAGSASAFEDLGGGLGPYNPNARGALGEDDQGSPGAGLLAALAAVGAALVLARRRASN